MPTDANFVSDTELRFLVIAKLYVSALKTGNDLEAERLRPMLDETHGAVLQEQDNQIEEAIQHLSEDDIARLGRGVVGT
ncbi:MAG: hypothetical protein GY952_13985 [Rhodobacteraceae bacterium]|nr:hypothetical protein [Paracoccaceae bacterium]